MRIFELARAPGPDRKHDGGSTHGVGTKMLWLTFEVRADQLHWDCLARDTTTFFGSSLRIDVESGSPGHAIPEAKPSVGKVCGLRS
ncbi:MAG: hypothetical protein R3C97_13530 [Geminicoccaceae bacterium]